VISRAAMIATQLRGRGIRSLAVLDALAAVPREAFVDPELRAVAYADRPLPIGYGQTISQPYIVALTAELLALHRTEHVLEIGTGSGYAAAILGRLAKRVDTIERIPELAERARATLASLGITNVHVHCADGSLGWPTGGPYDAIAVAANAPSPPPSLRAQLAIGGRLVLPVGDERRQRLVRIVRDDGDVFDERRLAPVAFVPLLGAEGWPAPA
jgi:protein-L-isoaspartate(D-aspartate) O-methyltransferase